ncbi:MAG TPA: copper resistance protein CopC [Longimicrobium sp.]|nr:copper resistance protein CopC [Longimicrobium sp.]
MSLLRRTTAALRLFARLLPVVTALAALPAPSLAHGALRRSVPASGAHLPTAPSELRLTFNESVELAIARLRLLGPDSVEVALAPLVLPPDSATVLVARITGPLRAGTYVVAWQVAGADGHPVRGTYSFVIAPGAQGLAPAATSAGPTAPGQAPPPASHHRATSLPEGLWFDAESPLYAMVRWLTYLGLLGVVGAVAFRFAVLPLVRRQGTAPALAILAPAAGRAARLGLTAAAVLALAGVLRLYAQSYALHGAEGALEPALVGTMLSRTVWGWGWLLQAVGTALVGAGFARARRAPRRVRPPREEAGEMEEVRETGEAEAPFTAASGAPAVAVAQAPVASVAATAPEPAREPSRTGWALAAMGAVALAFTPALSGHAASTPRVTALAILADGVHVLSAGGWIGGLLLVLAAGIPVALGLVREERGPAVAALVNAFSPTALLFAGALTVTGVFAAWVHLGSVPALWETAYGRTLLLKLAVLSAVFGTGAYNFLRVKPALDGEPGVLRLRRSAMVEIAVGVLVLAVTAVLVATATPADAA